MATPQGLARFPQILTEDDVLYHCYGGPQPAEALPSLSEGGLLAPEPDLSTSPTDPGPAPSDHPEADVHTAVTDHGPEPVDPASPPTAEELESSHTKAELQAMSEQAGLETTGTKAEIAARLAAHYTGK